VGASVVVGTSVVVGRGTVVRGGTVGRVVVVDGPMTASDGAAKSTTDPTATVTEATTATAPRQRREAPDLDER